MNSTKRRGGIRALAALGAIAVGLIGVAAPAAAADPEIDSAQAGTLTIHKYEQPATIGDPADGTVQDTTGLTALPGVVFSYQLVSGVDLTTNEGWTLAAQIAGGSALVAPEALGGSVDLPATDASGTASVAGLPLGLYLVTETTTPTTVVSEAQPFYVTVPLPTVGDVPGWNYDIHVYPKNAVAATPAKAINDTTALSLGDQVTYTVTAPVPAVAAQSELTGFVIIDDLDARLAYAASATVALSDSADAPVALVAADYAVSATDPVRVTFTATGLEKLFAAPNGEVTITINANVTGGDPVDLGDGTIENTATLYVNDSGLALDGTGTPLTTGFETNEVTTTWVPLAISKVDAASPTTGLAGAVFSVYSAATDGTLLDFNGVTEFTTAADGTVTIPGLKAGVTVYLEEVTAPDGFFGLRERIEVTIASSPVVTGDVVQAQVVQVTNDAIPQWLLPLTGGTGDAMFGVAGGVLLAAAAGSALIISRRKKARA